MNLLESKYIRKTNETKNIVIDGRVNNFPVYEIELEPLFYNDKNDRIITWSSQETDYPLEEYRKKDFEKYNNLFEKWIFESNQMALNRTKQNIQLLGQIEAGVVLNDGRVIDGNRRLTCLRMLQKENSSLPNKYKFKAVILDLNYENNSKKIKLLELNIQIGTDEKVSYNPIESMIGAYNDIVLKQTVTIEEYAEATRESVKKIKEKIEQSEFLIEFLEFIGAKNKYYIARENSLHDPILESVKIIKNAQKQEYSEDQINDLKNILFSNLLLVQSGDKTRFIRKITKIIQNKEFGNKLIREEQGIVDYVLDTLDNYVDENHNIKDLDSFLGEIANSNESEKVKQLPEKLIEQISLKEAENAPLKLIVNAIEKIDEIDNEIISKLDFDKINELIKPIEVLIKKSTKLKEMLKEINE
ncbi:hypothetical protein [Mycoplasma sp. CSL10166]|uniref:hypothetical protein n=1 Tax=Mycoplasma sp. CSL10166 TaxID=2813825 RepID=UPI00197C3666|nr:hypothetical protein [Mycoplasma sp. CSL10166]MBN4084086.1 hypothetical protein [Mycoplasma sp. CSL10166]